MKKNDQFDLSIPRRQSFFAIVLIIYKYYKIIIRQAWPVLLFIVVGGGGRNRANWESYALYAVIIASAFSMTLAILNYFRHYYHLTEDELHVRKGIFQKQNVSIPIERVQTVNFEENIFHRLFKVTSLKIDTAGSTKKEFDLDAVSIPEAKAIRDYILSKKSEVESVSTDDVEESVNSVNNEKLVTHLDLIDLLKIGVSYNHLRSAGLIFGGIFWLYYEIDELLPDYIDDSMVVEQAFTYGLLAILYILLLFVIVAFLYSLVRAVFRYYDLRFLRQDDGFKIKSGLFTRQEFSALDSKIQKVGWKDNLLQKKLFKIHDLNLKQAGSIAINAKKSFEVPGVSMEKIEKILAYHFPNLNLDLFDLSGVHPKMWYRSIFYLSLLFATIFTVIYSFGNVVFLLPTGAMYILLGISIYKRFQKTKYGISQGVLQLRGGTFADDTTLIKLHKIQAVQLVQSPYQQRHDLASIIIFTASGKSSIPYLPVEEATKVSDRLIYQVEKSNLPWM